jgi:hypothetical protein
MQMTGRSRETPPPVFAKLEVGFHARGANQVRPEKSGVLLNDGRALPYNDLVIATGPKLPSTR